MSSVDRTINVVLAVDRIVSNLGSINICAKSQVDSTSTMCSLSTASSEPAPVIASAASLAVVTPRSFKQENQS